MKRILLPLAILSVSVSASAKDEKTADSPETLWKKGVQLRDAVGAKHDDAAAVRLFERAAEAGFAAAERDLALMTKQSRGGLESDFFRAWDLLSSAAEKGDAEALFECAIALDSGYGVPQDEDRALDFYRRAAKAGNWEAARSVVYLEEDRGADEERLEKLRKNAVRLALAAAKEGDEDAMLHLGDAYYFGNGAPESDRKSREWISKALNQLEKKASAGDPVAMFDLGEFARWPRGELEPSIGEAKIRFRKSAELGYVPAMVSLAELLVRPSDDAPPPSAEDMAEARSWLQKAAEAKSAEGMSALGVMLVRGRGGPADRATAARLFEAAASLGLPDAMTNRGILFEEDGSFADAETWYLQADRYGDDEGRFRLGSMLLAGRKGFPADPARGLALIREPAERGYLDAVLAIADVFEKGIGRPKIPVQAACWLALVTDEFTFKSDDPVLFLPVKKEMTSFCPKPRNTFWWLGDENGFTPEFRAATARRALALLENQDDRISRQLVDYLKPRAEEDR